MEVRTQSVHFDADDTLLEFISKKVEKLHRFSDQIIHSRVVLDTPHNHKHKGKQYRASIELEIKGGAVTIARDDESIHVAVRDAFMSAERKIKQLSDKHKYFRETH